MYYKQAVVFSVAGHGMTVDAHPDSEHWGRRLMASVPDNETEQKNCSAPGMLFNEIKDALIFCFINSVKEGTHSDGPTKKSMSSSLFWPREVTAPSRLRNQLMLL